MNDPIFSAIFVLLGVGIVAAIVLVIAAKLLYVPNDERVDLLSGVLPSANCGACGYAGCTDYAVAVVAGTAELGLCTPGGNAVSVAMADIMGLPPVGVEEKSAVVRCRGSLDARTDKYEYTGVKNCVGAAMMYKGSSACPYGCLGYGDCKTICAFNAITVENGVAVIDKDNCTGCGMCAKVCPKKIIEVRPVKNTAVVLCINADKGALTRKTCSNGCIGCTKCAKICEFSAVEMKDNFAYIDHDKCTGCMKCVAGCPTKAIGTMLSV